MLLPDDHDFLALLLLLPLLRYKASLTRCSKNKGFPVIFSFFCILEVTNNVIHYLTLHIMYCQVASDGSVRPETISECIQWSPVFYLHAA